MLYHRNELAGAPFDRLVILQDLQTVPHLADRSISTSGSPAMSGPIITGDPDAVRHLAKTEETVVQAR